MKKKMIAIVLIVLLLGGATAGLIFGVRAKAYNEGRTLNAKVRYFDGECEMIELENFYCYSNTLVKLVTKAGDVMYIGPNNVIILDEEAET